MKKLIIILITTIASFSAQAQLFVDDCNPLVRSLEEVVYIVRQDYALEDKDGNLFGQNNNNFFNYAIGPGLVIDGRLVYSNYTYKPYLHDSSYKNYGKGYKPVSTNLYVKKIKADEMKKLDKTGEEKLTYAMVELDVPSVKANAEKAVKDSMKCMIITFLAKNKTDQDKSHYALSYIKNTVAWDGNTGTLKNTNLGADAVFGLLFYENIGHGQVNYQLGGFVERDDENKAWVITKFQKLKQLNSTGGKDDKKDKGSIWPWK